MNNPTDGDWNEATKPAHQPIEKVPVTPAKETSFQVPASFGRYQLIRELGRGNMGVVYLAHDVPLDRQVALKIPSQRLREDADALERFYREARAMATLQHPNLCPLYDIGRFEQWDYLTMAYVDGKPLSKLISNSGGLTVASSLMLIRKIAMALQVAHDAGIVHRDLKPSNIMVRNDFEPVIMDFGLARRDREGEAELTQQGAIFGTPAFMAPEQVEALHDQIGPATDLYAVGVILYQMLTGRLPFQGNTASIFGQIVSKQPDAPSFFRRDLPEDLDRVCLRCMRKLPEQRYANSREFIADLDGFSSETTQTIRVLPAPLTNRPAESDTTGPTSSQLRKREAELRQITVVAFSYEVLEDTAGSIDASASELSLEQEESFSAFIKKQVESFGGAWISNNGQEVLCCFGYPVAYEDASQRAVRSALETFQKLKNNSSDSELPRSEHVWCTIHSGEVVAETSEDGVTSEITLAGDARTTAQRAHSIVEPGTICVTASTHKRVSLYFETTPLGKLRVRGLAQPVELFRVEREANSRNRVDLLDPGNLSPLVGRDTELAILKGRWEQAIEGLGQIVLLVGEAGLGKSRLIRELREHVCQDESQSSAILEFRCSEYHASTGLFPIAEAWTRLLDWEKTELSGRWDKLDAYLKSLKITGANSTAILGNWLGLSADNRFAIPDITPQKIKERTMDLLIEWLERLSEQAPVLIVFEDLHWIDPSSLEFLSKHVNQNQMSTVLTLLTFRPQFEIPWKNSPHQTQIALNRLTRKQVGDWIKRQVGRKDISDSLLGAILERTDGIPLFIEEFTKVLCDSGALEAKTLPETTSDWFKVIPATLNDLLMSRLDSMASEKDVIQIASAIGREFSFELLSAASTHSVVDLTMELEKLVKAEIVFQKGTGTNAVYIFKHALLQDAAYRSMLSKRRQGCHERIARALEEHFPSIAENQPELVAQHYSEAGLAQQAIAYWTKAGLRAQGRSQNQEAIEHFRHGLHWIQQLAATKSLDPASLAALELGMTVPLGVSLLAAKGYASPEAGPVFDRALVLANSAGDPTTKFYILWGMWAWRLVRSDLNDCRSLIEQMLQVANQLKEKHSDSSWTSEANFAPQVVDYYSGDFSQSCTHAQRALDQLVPSRCSEHLMGTGQDVRTSVLPFYSMSLWPLGRVGLAVEKALESIELGRTLHHPMSHSFALHHGTWTLLCARMWDQALPLVQEAAELAKSQGLTLWIASSTAHLGACLLHTGKPQEGLELLEQGFEGFIATGGCCAVPLYMNWIAQGYLLSHRSSDAYAWIQRSIEWAKEHDQQNHVLSDSYRVLGEILAADPNLDSTTADSQFEKAVQIALSQNALSWELRARLAWAKFRKQSQTAPIDNQAIQSILDRLEQAELSPDWSDATRWLAGS